ncbi:hypothetical protein BZM27_48255 [Paraburkholderia steynii]|uniref:Uncharacterized protein n=1 Tax=Paraburkholderia steynii TaxID=1245441 RepID=A0A4R0X9W7_9BURK|nr:hypothetical protein BZM27_48255 [Paraburkholderia steynii]
MGSVKHAGSVKCVQVDRIVRRSCAGSVLGTQHCWPPLMVGALTRRMKEVPHTRVRTTTGSAKTTARAKHGCPGERHNGTLRFTVGRSTLNPSGLTAWGSIASHAGVSALVYWNRVE